MALRYAKVYIALSEVLFKFRYQLAILPRLYIVILTNNLYRGVEIRFD